MRHLKDCGRTGARAHVVKGLAFEIADLVLARSWADRHAFRMLVCLDYGAAVGEEYEEAIAFQTATSPLYRFVISRDSMAVFVHPFVGTKKRYGSVAEALNRLLPRDDIILTDITATEWPADLAT